MQVVALLGGLGSQMFKYAFYLALCEKTAQTTNRVFFSRIEDAKDDGIQLKAPRFIKRHVSKVLAFRKDTESKNCR